MFNINNFNQEDQNKIITFAKELESKKEKVIYCTKERETWMEWFSSYCPGWSAFSSVGSCISSYFIEPVKDYVLYPIQEKLSGITDFFWNKTPWKWLIGVPMTVFAVVLFWGPATRSGEEISKWLSTWMKWVESISEVIKYTVGVINLLSRGALNLNALFPFFEGLYKGIAAIFASIISCDLEVFRKNFLEHVIFFVGLVSSLLASVFPIFPWTWTNLVNSQGWYTLLYLISTFSRLAVYSGPISLVFSILLNLFKKDGFFAQYIMSRDEYLKHLCKTLDEETLQKLLEELDLSGKTFEEMDEKGREDLFEAIEKKYSWGTWFSSPTNWLRLVIGIVTQFIAFVSALGGHLSFMNLAEVEYLQYLCSFFVIFSAPLFMKSMNEFMNIIYNGLSELHNGKPGSNILHGLFFVFSLILGLVTSFSYRSIVMANVQKTKIEWMQSLAMKWIWSITAIWGSIVIHSKAVYNLLVKLTNSELLKKLADCISALFSCMQNKDSKENSKGLENEIETFKNLLKELDSEILASFNEQETDKKTDLDELNKLVEKFLSDLKKDEEEKNKEKINVEPIDDCSVNKEFDKELEEFDFTENCKELKNEIQDTEILKIKEKTADVVNALNKGLREVRPSLEKIELENCIQKLKQFKDPLGLVELKSALELAEQILQGEKSLKELEESKSLNLVTKVKAHIEKLEKILILKSQYTNKLDKLKEFVALLGEDVKNIGNNKRELIKSANKLLKVINANSAEIGTSKYGPEVDKIMEQLHKLLKAEDKEDENKIKDLQQDIKKLLEKVTNLNTLRQLKTKQFMFKPKEEVEKNEENKDVEEIKIDMKEEENNSVYRMSTENNSSNFFYCCYGDNSGNESKAQEKEPLISKKTDKKEDSNLYYKEENDNPLNFCSFIYNAARRHCFGW